MTDETIQRVLGQLETGMANLAKQHETFRIEHREDLGKIFRRLDEFPLMCPTGKHCAEAIHELQKRPERLVGIGAAIIAILSAIGSAFLWMHGKLGVSP